MRLEGKTAVVVGAGQTPGDTIGNGRATSILFAREGARVLLVDRDEQSATETAKLVEDEGGEAHVVRGDVTDSADCRAVVDTAVETFGRIDIVHHNVGVGGGDGPAHRVDEDVWRKILDINLTGAFLMAKHVIPVMREQRGGSLVFVSSIASICAMPAVAYKVSKAGVDALTQQLAIANAKYGVRVNAILPGLMNTPMAVEGLSEALGVAKDDLIRFRDDQVPLRRKMGTAWDVAHAAAFLASDEAGFITGVLLPVDGGQSARRG